jgi:hypothetical protein
VRGLGVCWPIGLENEWKGQSGWQWSLIKDGEVCALSVGSKVWLDLSDETRHHEDSPILRQKTASLGWKTISICFFVVFLFFFGFFFFVFLFVFPFSFSFSFCTFSFSMFGIYLVFGFC